MMLSVPAGIIAAAISAIVAIAIFSVDRSFAALQRRKEAERTEFERIINEARETVLSIIEERPGPSDTPYRAYITPGLVLQLTLPLRQADTVRTVELLVTRIHALSVLSVNSDTDRTCRVEQLQQTLTTLATVLAYRHHRQLSRTALMPLIVSLQIESVERSAYVAPMDLAWWQQPVPDWLRAPSSQSRVDRWRQNLSWHARMLRDTIRSKSASARNERINEAFAGLRESQAQIDEARTQQTGVIARLYPQWKADPDALNNLVPETARDDFVRDMKAYDVIQKQNGVTD